MVAPSAPGQVGLKVALTAVQKADRLVDSLVALSVAQMADWKAGSMVVQLA